MTDDEMFEDAGPLKMEGELNLDGPFVHLRGEVIPWGWGADSSVSVPRGTLLACCWRWTHDTEQILRYPDGVERCAKCGQKFCRTQMARRAREIENNPKENR